jgi:hypothetical protein
MRLPEKTDAALDFLEREERETLAELERELIATGEEVARIDDVRRLVRRHPHLAVLTSAAAGAALAPLLASVARAALPLLKRACRRSDA